MALSDESRPRYQEKMIIGLIRETKTIEDLTDLCNLLRDIEEQKDLTITFKINQEVQIQQKTIIYGGDILGDKTI